MMAVDPVLDGQGGRQSAGTYRCSPASQRRVRRHLGLTGRAWRRRMKLERRQGQPTSAKLHRRDRSRWGFIQTRVGPAPRAWRSLRGESLAFRTMRERGTLAEWARRLDPEGKVAGVVELLAATNNILEDCRHPEPLPRVSNP